MPSLAFIGKNTCTPLTWYGYFKLLVLQYDIFYFFEQVLLCSQWLLKSNNFWEKSFTLRLFLPKSLLNLILLLDHYDFARVKDYTFFTFLSIVRDLFLLMLNTYSNWIRMTRRGLTLKIEGVTFNHFVFQ